MICIICRHAEIATGMACDRDRAMLGRLLRDIPDRWLGLHNHGPDTDTPWTVTQHRPVLDRKGKPIRVNGQVITRTTTEPGADISLDMPMANTSRRIGPPLSGSTEAPAPVPLDHLDLTGPARLGSIGIDRRGPHAATGDPDQIGHLAVATELDYFVREWQTDRGAGERLPIATVPVLAGWLTTRLDWACNHSITLDEFAATLRRVNGALGAALGLTPARPQVMDQPCPACGYLTLIRRPGEDWIDCDRQECGSVWTMAEYADRLRTVADLSRERMAA